MSQQKKFEPLQQLHLPIPPFIFPNMNFFPHQFLSAACAGWSVHTAVTFLNSFYERLEIASPLTTYMAQFEGLYPLRMSPHG